MAEFLELEYYKRWFRKVLDRLNESKWTQLVMLISILQAITIIILELRVYSRNNDIEQSLNTVGSITDELVLNATCVFQPAYVRLNNIRDENIIQWVEVKKWYIDFEEDCPGRLSLHTQFLKYDAPLISALLLFSIIMGFICFKLYQQFGWNIYKKIGADLSMQALNVYVVTISKLSGLKNLRYMPIQFYMFHLVITICVAINQLLAYRSVRKEWKVGMYFVFFIWSACILDFTILLYYSIGDATGSWYFFIIFIIFGIIMAATTLVWSIFVFSNFDTGLKDIIYKSHKKTEDGLLDESQYKRFSIEDD
ncbi:23701_t:CDS:2 [Cetraspora pellucida]|uniref:23701_t:CDS:1 n=1 Tax=Cetraspora pellucida TaxID=1433469 RepID=A0A9N9EUX5_9GLOM|nr:23701_t:CDS:2 [Cetraspora pellucida]